MNQPDLTSLQGWLKDLFEELSRLAPAKEHKDQVSLKSDFIQHIRKVKLGATTHIAEFQLIKAQKLSNLMHYCKDKVEDVYLINLEPTAHDSKDLTDLVSLVGEFQKLLKDLTSQPFATETEHQSYAREVHFTQIIVTEAIEPSLHPEYLVEFDLCWDKERVLVESATDLRALMLKKMCSTSFGGHVGVEGTYASLKILFYMEGLVRQCDICHRTEAAGEVDIMLVHKLSKNRHFLALFYPYTTQGVANSLLDSIYELHGAPNRIDLDKDKVFINLIWRELLREWVTQRQATECRTIDSGGKMVSRVLVQRVNSRNDDMSWEDVSWEDLKQVRRLQIPTDPCGQGSKLGESSITGMSMVIGEKIIAFGTEQVLGMKKGENSDCEKKERFDWEKKETMEWVSQRQTTGKELKENFRLTQQGMEFFPNNKRREWQVEVGEQFFPDNKRREREVEVGELVYLKLQPFSQNAVLLHRNLKLSSRYYGPYRILEKFEIVVYELDLPGPSSIHPIFHVSLLQKSLGEDALPSTDLPESNDDGVLTIAAAAALNHRDSKEVAQVLFRRINRDDISATWNELKLFHRRVPDFDPWGQGSFDEGSIVMTVDSISQEVERKSKSTGTYLNLGLVKKMNFDCEDPLKTTYKRGWISSLHV